MNQDLNAPQARVCLFRGMPDMTWGTNRTSPSKGTRPSVESCRKMLRVGISPHNRCWSSTANIDRRVSFSFGFGTHSSHHSIPTGLGWSGPEPPRRLTTTCIETRHSNRLRIGMTFTMIANCNPLFAILVNNQFGCMEGDILRISFS